MPDYITATVFTNLDPKHNSTPRNFQAKFPCMPQLGNTVLWDDRRCRIIDICWHQEGLLMQPIIEINK